jgi:hypothetical protein
MAVEVSIYITTSKSKFSRLTANTVDLHVGSNGVSSSTAMDPCLLKGEAPYNTITSVSS